MTGNANKNGFTLLFASLVGVLLLALGIATFNIVLRELNLSSTARESTTAFYAADSGWECAFYWDRKRPALFATSTYSSSIPVTTSILCHNQTITVSSSARDQYSALSIFHEPLDDAACADVTIEKRDDDQDKISSTKIESRGRNDCGASPIPNRVERAIRVNY